MKYKPKTSQSNSLLLNDKKIRYQNIPFQLFSLLLHYDKPNNHLISLNSEIEIVCIEDELTDRNIGQHFSDVHGVIDALDNFPDRFMVNEFSVKHRLPFFHGAVRGFEGRVMTIIPGSTACFRCIYSEAPPNEVFPVVGVSPTLVAAVQVTEAIKYFVGVGELLAGQLLIYDGESMTFIKTEMERIPGCPVCGEM